VPFASVIVDIPTRALREPFTYAIPDELVSELSIGCAVLVDFGNRPAVGWVIDLLMSTELERVRPLRSVLSAALFDSTSALLALEVARDYCAPPIEALRLFLPPGAAPRLAKRTVDGVETWALEEPSVGPVDERWVERVPESDFRPARNATMQRALLDALVEGPVSAAELRAALGSVDGALRRLESTGSVRIEERRRFRASHGAGRPAPRHGALSDGQTEALRAIANATVGETILLDGVTGSGKTEVYLRSIESCVERSLSAVVLVPEISLTPQTVGRFRTRFGASIAVLHSRLGAGERRDEWDRIASGEARVVIGARSALFAPIQNLGIIVIDEEHSSSYKQGQAPRYDARSVAARVAKARSAVLVLGSATPSMEMREAAERGELTRIALPERVGGGVLPVAQIVDMGVEFNAGHRSMFSRPLTQALLETAEAGHRAVLLLNRRGFASFLLCRECGYVPTCESCSTSLTFHDAGRPRLVCHHCGAIHTPPATCPDCGGPYLRQFGAGTQRVEAELRELLPDTPIVRMDADTTTGKGGHERVLTEFESLPGGVLIGTQMVAKGLDYPDVALVGVLNADTTLHLPDFRSAERTYQLLAQVAGRAGRGDIKGRVVIQTYWPDHPAIRSAAFHDPESFYLDEAITRKELRYPPFGRLANVVVSGVDEAAVKRSAEILAAALKASAGEKIEVLGPCTAPLARVKRQHRWHVLVRGARDTSLSSLVCEALEEVPRADGVSLAPDIDPADLL